MAVYLYWKCLTILELKSGKAMYLIWLSCISSQNVYLDPNLVTTLLVFNKD